MPRSKIQGKRFSLCPKGTRGNGGSVLTRYFKHAGLDQQFLSLFSFSLKKLSMDDKETRSSGKNKKEMEKLTSQLDRAKEELKQKNRQRMTIRSQRQHTNPHWLARAQTDLPIANKRSLFVDGSLIRKTGKVFISCLLTNTYAITAASFSSGLESASCLYCLDFVRYVPSWSIIWDGWVPCHYLVAKKRLYMKVRPSVGWSVCRKRVFFRPIRSDVCRVHVFLTIFAIG